MLKSLAPGTAPMLRYAPLFILLVAGCSKPEPVCYPVEVQAEFYGKPPIGYIVEFSSQEEDTKGINASGTIEADGTIKLKSMVNGKEKDGAVAGKHKVVVVPPPSGKGPAVILPVPLLYADYSTSGLTCEVTPGGNNTCKIALRK